MAEKSAMNSLMEVEHFNSSSVDVGIKKEVVVKPEPCECLVCVTRSQDCYDIYTTNTTASGTSLLTFLAKFTQTDITDAVKSSKHVCKNCLDLINILDQAEIEYVKLKEAFEAIISKNPLFVSSNVPLKLTTVKAEYNDDEDDDDDDDDDDVSVHFNNLEEDSENEPLVKCKRKRKVQVKKNCTTAKHTPNSKKFEGSWKCELCGETGDKGGTNAEEAHRLSVHSGMNSGNNGAFNDVKTEDSADGSESPFKYTFKESLLLALGNLDESSKGDEKIKKKKTKATRKKKKVLKDTKTKVMHQCDQCTNRYTSLVRLERHKQIKHEGSKPPYICEICGAHYKHKRACDIHIALHKGISDWKCEECNKLFPSKNALQRHNNIHTGKFNYQCDLCGKSFIHTSSFKMHKLSHSGVKPHSCDVCGLALMTRSHLKRHKRVHSGEKRHECALCGKRFSERYNLMAHAKSHHGPEARAAEPPRPERRRLFRCHFCPERYERRYMLERHMPAAHGRTLERPPPTPRNTMSKMLKAQALGKRAAPPDSNDPESKEERSPQSRGATPAPLAAPSPALLAAATWSGAYAAEFGIRPDFPH